MLMWQSFAANNTLVLDGRSVQLAGHGLVLCYSADLTAKRRSNLPKLRSRLMRFMSGSRLLFMTIPLPAAPGDPGAGLHEPLGFGD
jgi:hypothetical protein